MLGSRDSVASPNVVLNAIMAEVFADACDELEQAENFDEAVHDMIKRNFTEHHRVIFNGNGYSEAWVEEAARRGLPNIQSTVYSISELTSEESVRMFERFNIFTEAELQSRAEVKYENYAKTVSIEARTMLTMARKQMIPAAIRYAKFLAEMINAVRGTGIADVSVEMDMLTRIMGLIKEANTALQVLEEAEETAQRMPEGKEMGYYYYDIVAPAMKNLRAPIDTLESIVDKSYWPLPSYGDMLNEV